MTDNEPTEAAVCRMMLRGCFARADEAVAARRSATAEQFRVEGKALYACMKAAGWSTEEPTEPDSDDPLAGQSILDAG